MKVEVYTLSNGMQVWLDEDHTTPTVFGGVAVKAGAKDCPDTGIAHYFEHIMFKGTDKIGTVDYALEKPILDAIEAEYGRLREVTDPVQRKAILGRINELTVENAKYTIPNEFSQLITLFGGSGLNAGTSHDHTIYHNVFSSHNIEPWLELNSERLLNPVFRLFQSELETVYEEKNMYSDHLVMGAVEHVMERVFAPHPYARPIIGSTENLKNPDMAAMRAFYERYYVAGNMALVLCGDFDTAEVLPLVEKYFSRIPAGEAPRTSAEMPRTFEGREVEKVKIPIPIIKAGANVWRTVPAEDPDEAVLEVATTLLSNANETGSLDKLTKERKVMAAMAANIAMNDAGILALVYVPKAIFMGLKGAEKLALEALGKVRRGDFTDEELENAKREYDKSFQQRLENQQSRAYTILQAYTGGKTWEEYLAERGRVAGLTREDIVAVLGKYLGDNRLVLEKKTGSYPKDKLDKPGFEPVKPQTEVTQSEYGARLVERNLKIVAPRFIDPAADMAIGESAGGERVFAVRNPYNDIFKLEFSYPGGYNQIPAAEYLFTYLGYSDVGELTGVEFQEKLRAVGATIDVWVGEERSRIVLSGFDGRFEESYALLRDYLDGLKPNDKGVKSILEMMRIERGAVKKEAAAMSEAALQYVLYGANSPHLREMTAAEVKAYPEDGFIRDLHTILGYKASIYYSGGKSLEEVVSVVGGDAGVRGERAWYPRLVPTEPTVYLIDAPKSRQSIINRWVDLGEMTEPRERALANLFNMYVGGSMNALLFQEIREYHSYAYAIGSQLSLPRRDEKERNGAFGIYMTTQIDKTSEALGTLDSLMAGLTFTQERLDRAKMQMINDMNNSFPNFREIAGVMDNYMEQGYTEDPRRALFEELSSITVEELQAFYERRIAGKPVIHVIGSDMKKLGGAADRFGRVVTLKTKEIVL